VPKVSVTIITKDEATNIADALASVAWADEIVVVDSSSTDGTAVIARAATPRVFVREWPGYIEQKNFAASQASNDWIFSMDADERVTPNWRDIRAAVDAPAHAAYRMPRVTWHLDAGSANRLVSGLQTRLYDRRVAHWTGRYVHEAVTVTGSVGQLRGELQHFAYRDISDHLDTIDRYTRSPPARCSKAAARLGVAAGAARPLAFLRTSWRRAVSAWASPA